jgi:hypothetical protein
MDQSSLPQELKFNSPIVDHGIEFWSIETYYQAMKVSDDDLDLRRWIASLSPGEARQVGQRLDALRRLELEEERPSRTDEAQPSLINEARREVIVGEWLSAGVGAGATDQGYVSNTRQDGQRIQFWEELDEKLREGLTVRGVTQATWNNWNSDQRQEVLNNMAVLMEAGVWDHVSGIQFGTFNVVDKRGAKNDEAHFTPDASGYALAITIDKDIQADLVKAGFGYESDVWSHPEGKWALEQKEMIMSFT